MKTIILGLGNPLFCDDAVGLFVAQAVESRLAGTDIDVAGVTVSGLDVPELIAGYRKAIIIDAVQTPCCRPGAIHRIDFARLSHITPRTPHNMDFLTSLMLARRLGLTLPEIIVIFAIEIANVADIGRECTPPVQSAVPQCVKMIMDELEICIPAGK